MSDLIGIGELSRAVNLHINTLRKLADEGEIPSKRTFGGQRRFSLEQVRRALEDRNRSNRLRSKSKLKHSESKKWHETYPLSDLREDEVWRRIVKDLQLDMNEKCADIIPYAFTEMLNNAIEHSHGSHVEVTFEQSEESWNFLICDDGQGAFQCVANAFDLSSSLEAIAEFTKGKRTSAPSTHTGEGIFFTSKSVDLFEIESDGLIWTVDNLRDDFAVGEARRRVGTRVFCSLARDTPRTLISVFQKFTQDRQFNKSRPVIKLFETGMMFVSRSEARRLVIGLDKFSDVNLDFKKVNSVGQGFVDEVFRVWADSHPDTKLIPINMNATVEFMVLRGKKR